MLSIFIIIIIFSNIWSRSYSAYNNFFNPFFIQNNVFLCPPWSWWSKWTNWNGHENSCVPTYEASRSYWFPIVTAVLRAIEKIVIETDEQIQVVKDWGHLPSFPACSLTPKLVFIRKLHGLCQASHLATRASCESWTSSIPCWHSL